MDYMRPDIVALLRGSDSSYVRELIGMDPVAVFRWAVLRASIRAMAVLREAGRLRAERAEKAAGRGKLCVTFEKGTFRVHFEVHLSVTFSIFIVECSHHLCLVPELFCRPKQKLPFILLTSSPLQGGKVCLHFSLTA